MRQYLDLMEKILREGEEEMDRTGTGTLSIHNEAIHFDLSQGFPILTTKFVPLRLVATELEFFIKGLTSKRWLQERNCHIWDEWCSPDEFDAHHGLPTMTREEKLRFQKDNDNLGPIYGYQWRNWNDAHGNIDQLKEAISKCKNNQMDRAIIVSAWNVADLKHMALRPCHTGFQLLVRPSGKLDLSWQQRSNDFAIGNPFNIASYALLTHLIAKECNLVPGKLTAFMGDVHLYKNHLEQAREQITRTPGPLPTLEFTKWNGFFEWEAGDCKLNNYNHQGKIHYPISV